VASFVHTDNRQTKLGYNLAWAKTYLRRVGAVENSGRGIWAITKAGERLTLSDVSKVPQIVRRQDYERRRDQNGEDEPTTEEAVAAERPPPEETWKDRLLAALRAMMPDAFERLAQRLLREAGFVKVEVTGRSGDGGIEVSAFCGSIWSPSRCFSNASGIKARWDQERFATFAAPWSAVAIRG